MTSATSASMLTRGGRGRTFESCRAHGSTKPFSRARNAEKCTIRPSYSASAAAGEADEPCSEGAGGEGVLGLADRRRRRSGRFGRWATSRSASAGRVVGSVARTIGIEPAYHADRYGGTLDLVVNTIKRDMLLRCHHRRMRRQVRPAPTAVPESTALSYGAAGVVSSSCDCDGEAEGTRDVSSGCLTRAARHHRAEDAHPIASQPQLRHLVNTRDRAAVARPTATARNGGSVLELPTPRAPERPKS